MKEETKIAKRLLCARCRRIIARYAARYEGKTLGWPGWLNFWSSNKLRKIFWYRFVDYFAIKVSPFAVLFNCKHPPRKYFLSRLHLRLAQNYTNFEYIARQSFKFFSTMKFNYFTFMFNYVVKRAIFCCVHGMIQQFSPTIALLIRSRGFWARRAKLLVAKGCQEVRKFKPLGRVT